MFIVWRLSKNNYKYRTFTTLTCFYDEVILNLKMSFLIILGTNVLCKNESLVLYRVLSKKNVLQLHYILLYLPS